MGSFKDIAHLCDGPLYTIITYIWRIMMEEMLILLKVQMGYKILYVIS